MHDDLAMMKDPALWPVYPYLPVKKPSPDGGWPTLGVLIEDATEATVFFTNMFELPLTEAQLIKVPKKEYASFEDMVADGWIVD